MILRRSRRRLRDDVASIAVEQARRRFADRIANLFQHALRLGMPFLCSHVEKVGGHCIVARDAAAIGVHPAKAVLGLNVPETGSFAVKLNSTRRFPFDAFAMLIGSCFFAQRQCFSRCVDCLLGVGVAAHVSG